MQENYSHPRLKKRKKVNSGKNNPVWEGKVLRGDFMTLGFCPEKFLKSVAPVRQTGARK
jgi:hypothetical protein